MRRDYLGLEAFLFIAELGSFRRAANYLHLSQAAVSHRLRKFEEQLGLQLIVRSNRGVSLTKAGVELLPKVRPLFDEIDASLESLKHIDVPRRSKLVIASIPTLAHYLLPEVLQNLHLEHSDFEVKIHETSARGIGELVSDGTVELALTIMGANRWDLDAEPLFEETYVLVCPAGHAYAPRASVSWKDVSDEPLIRVSPETGNRMILDEALGMHALSLRWSHEVQHSVTALSFVKAGIGLTVTPDMVARSATNDRCAIVPIRDPTVIRTVGVLRRRNDRLSPIADAFMNLLSDAAARLKR